MSVLILYIEKRFHRHASDYIRHICYSIFLFRWKDVQTIKHPYFLYTCRMSSSMLQCLFIQTSSHLFRNKNVLNKTASREGEIWAYNMHPNPIWISNNRKICNEKKKNRRKNQKKEKNGYTTFTVHFFTSFMFTHLYILYQYTACWYPRRIPTDKKSV